MKKKLSAPIVLSFLICFGLFLTAPLFLVGCSVEPRSEEDVIPTKLGKAEGYWLYRENTRMRTDGSEAEPILTSVEIGETTYASEEFTVTDAAYIRDTFEIFFVIGLNESQYVYHYNYLTKTSACLYALPAGEDYRVSTTNMLAYVSDEETRFGVLFSRSAQLLYEDFYGELDGDILMNFNGGFQWIKNGELHAVEGKFNKVGGDFNKRDYIKNGNFVYFFTTQRLTAIDLTTGKSTTVLEMHADSGRVDIENTYSDGDNLYLLTKHAIGDNEQVYRAYRINGASVEQLFDFGNNHHPHGVVMTVDGTRLYFQQKLRVDLFNKYYSYNMQTGEKKRIRRSECNGVGISKYISELQKQKATVTVGDYSYYVTSIDYCDEPDMFGSHYTKTCYYLMRKSGGREEVMQYSLSENGGYFFDDIREF